MPDFAKMALRDAWLRHPVLGDPSFDSFEKLGDTVHRSEAPYEWAVNGSLFRDPKDGACYLFGGLYCRGYACDSRHPSQFNIYRSTDNCAHFEPLGLGFSEENFAFRFRGHDAHVQSCPDVNMFYDEKLGKYLLTYDCSDEGVTWENAHQEIRPDSGSALAWADSPAGPFHQFPDRVFSNVLSTGRTSIFDRGYATTVLPRKNDYLALVLMDSDKHFAWALAAMTAPSPEGPWSEARIVLSPETDGYYPAPVEFYPAFVHEGTVYAPATSVAGNRNYQALFACDLERAHLATAWRLEQDGSLWHSRPLKDEAYGIWGQTFHGFVHDGQFTVMYPARNNRGFGTLSVARRPWDQPFRDGFTLSGHMNASIAPLLRSHRDFELQADFALTGAAAVYFDFHGVLGPSMISSDAAPHPSSRTAARLVRFDDQGRYALISRSESGAEQTLLEGNVGAPVTSLRLTRRGDAVALSINGRAEQTAMLPGAGGALAIGADKFSVLTCSRFCVEGEAQDGALLWNAQEALLNAGQLESDWEKRPASGVRGGDVFVGEGAVRAKWNFIGDGFTLYAPVGPEFGAALVYVDGFLAGSVPLTRPEGEPSAAIFHMENLEYGRHAVVLRPRRGKIAVDALAAEWKA